jgi:hypothetical protein
LQTLGLQAFSVQTHCPPDEQPHVLQSTVLVSPALHAGVGHPSNVQPHAPPTHEQLLQPSAATLVSPSLHVVDPPVVDPPVVDPPHVSFVQLHVPFEHEQMLQPSLAFAVSDPVHACPSATGLVIEPTGSLPPQPLAAPKPKPNATRSHW